jgi:S-DNA-T family DNA segregation ATPase FtsK/SpoIIIE
LTSKAATSKAGRTTASRTRKTTAGKTAAGKGSAASKAATRTSRAKSSAKSQKAQARARYNGKSIKTPMDAELSARAVALVQRGFREVLAILFAVVSILMMIALLTYHVSDPSWSHTGGYGQIRNATGIFGAWFADIVMFLLGYVAYVLPIALAIIGWNAFRDAREFTAPVLVAARISGIVGLLIAACGLADLHLFVHRGDLPIGTGGGGVLGTWVAGNMVRVVDPLGTTMLLLALLFGSITMTTGVSWTVVIERIGVETLRAARFGKAWLARTLERVDDYLTYREARRQRLATQAAEVPEPVEPELKAAPVIVRANIDAETDTPVDTAAPATRKAAKKAAPSATKDAASPSAPDRKISITERPAPPPLVAPPAEEKQFQLFETGKVKNPTSPGEIPPVSLLDDIVSARVGYSQESLEHLSRLLETKLAEFNVVIEVVEVHPGPVVTRFEAMPAPGVKVSKITNLAKDIARSLSVMSVRVVEVIAGKPTIGLEIPNEDREIVQLTEILQSKVYQGTKSPLAIALGKDISGLPVVSDLAKMPHLLVAGTTGSGKSVAVNAMLVSLLYKATADQVRLILIDPKMLELNVYEGIPHLLAPVVTDMKEAANALRWCVGEMERRYRLMAALGVRNIAGFNKKVKDAIAAGEPLLDPLYKPEEAFDPSAPAPALETLPFIVVVVDEFADMMMVVGKKVEELIARIAQKARAAGIHLVLATQRPSVDVITGLIKANIPTRMAFQVSSRIDSRTIIDQGGAEALLGHGDMLFLPPGTAHPERVHGAFVDDHEVHSVVSWLKESGTAVYVDEILQENTLPLPGMASEGEPDGEKDALYDQAVAIVTETRKASISYVQRRLKIGYNRAARIVEDMEAAGVVSAVQHNGSREVIAPPPVDL